MLHLNFAVSLTGYLKRSHRKHLLPIFLLFDLFFIYYLDWQRQKCKLKCLKCLEIYSEFYRNCNCCLKPFLLIQTLLPKNLRRIHLLQLKTHNIWMKFFWKHKIFHLDIKEISTLKQVIGYITFNKTVCWYVIVALF